MCYLHTQQCEYCYPFLVTINTDKLHVMLDVDFKTVLNNFAYVRRCRHLNMYLKLYVFFHSLMFYGYYFKLFISCTMILYDVLNSKYVMLNLINYYFTFRALLGCGNHKDALCYHNLSIHR